MLKVYDSSNTELEAFEFNLIIPNIFNILTV